MTIRTILLVSLLFPSLCMHAQNDEPYRWKNGFILMLSGDTMAGKIKTNDFLDVHYDFYHNVSFKDRKEVITHYTPDDLISFSYVDDRDSIHQMVTMESRSSPQGDGHFFMRLYCTGSCKVYAYTISEIKGAGQGENNTVRSSLVPTEKKFIQVRGSDFIPLKRISFKKIMKTVFADCPTIISRINAKVYTYDNWLALINYYNSGCK